MRVVLDTNVLFSGLRSRNRASFRVLELLGTERFEPCISVPLVLEYEQTLRRKSAELGMDEWDIGDVLDYVCSVCIRQPVFYLWRPILPDPSDDMVLELAVAAECEAIVTYNKSHFVKAAEFGLDVIDARELLVKLGELP